MIQRCFGIVDYWWLIYVDLLSLETDTFDIHEPVQC